MKTVLIIAAHPDDEILGVGGTARRHVLEGDSVHSIVVCEGETVRYQGRDIGMEAQARRAAEILGCETLDWLGFGDQRLDAISLTELTAPLEARLRRLRPSIVYTHFAGDLNRDHRILAEAVTVATRPIESYIEEVIAFETPSATEWNVPYRFAPNHFVEISSTLQAKLDAMACYTTEVREAPYPRSLESLRQRAAYWGSMAMVPAAEAFVINRRIRRASATLGKTSGGEPR